jgi:hypothetical protein
LAVVSRNLVPLNEKWGKSRFMNCKNLSLPFDSKRTNCHTESKATSRDASKGYPNVTIRLVREPR